MPTTVRLNTDLEQRIRKLAAETGRSQSFYINQMIEREIDRIEWEYAILRDVEAHRAGELKTVSHRDLKAELGLDD
ncbi:type II toxin-antitoxin system RelB family antitoxin [Brevibacterium salitolerans]|jgi:RHH-type rel operon transcriptional repressor/antitoxin RelB|uniref:Ribbon-helix-helix protein, CopG family n=1 Tax=Brevibacterium salitolerans TaxID=1403566 RepID=A0ABN2X030_9MICO